MRLAKLLVLGFIAGFLATLIFHQGLWYLLYQVGFIPPDRPAWPPDPVPPFAVPSVISKAFWGGLWGAALSPFLVRASGPAYWLAWIFIGAFALTLVSFYVVSPIKGEPFPALWPRFYYALLVNGTWGFGTALLLRVFRASG
ncbi:MAG TPA: hypothetical protein VHK26_14715 [Methyloceanibacter sp.]|jgi:hypothetical protein|nr:hypothetical protein [Methyloceanibacter sp.]